MKSQWWVLVVAAIAMLLYFDPLGKFDPGVTVLKSDTTVVNVPDIYVTIPPGKPTVITVTIPQVVDTAKIIQDYYTTVMYHDSIESDSVKVLLTEWVKENKIIDRKLKTSFKFTTSNINTYVEAKRNKVYIGGAVNLSGRPSLSVSGVIANKRDQLIIGSYDPFNRSATAGFLIKIGRK